MKNPSARLLRDGNSRMGRYRGCLNEEGIGRTRTPPIKAERGGRAAIQSKRAPGNAELNTSSSPRVAVNSPVDDIFGALTGAVGEAILDVPCLFIRMFLTLAKDHDILKKASFEVPPDTNALCQRMANEVHRDVLPGDSHVTAMKSFKGEFGLSTKATTTPGLLKVMFVAMASRKIRVQRRLLGLRTTPAPRKRRKVRCREDVEDGHRLYAGCCRCKMRKSQCPWIQVIGPLDIFLPPYVTIGMGLLL